jgi:hypothetical protein
MKQNSQNLSQHLKNLLQLWTINLNAINDNQDDDQYLDDREIVFYATKYGIPPTISIAGSLNSEKIATITVCIITPDVRDDERFDHLAW